MAMCPKCFQNEKPLLVLNCPIGVEPLAGVKFVYFIPKSKNLT